MYKKIYNLLGLSMVVSVFTFSFVSAQDVVDPTVCDRAPDAAICEANQADQGDLLGPNGLITNVAQAFVYIAGILAVILIAIGGIRYATSGGDPGQTKAAKETIIYAIIGLIVAIFAQGLVAFVLSRV